MDSEIQVLINSIIYSSHIIILAKGVLDIYPFYKFEQDKWLIQAMKLNIDRDWNKEMKGLLIYYNDDLVFSKGYQTWVSRNYVLVKDVLIQGEWINELPKLRDSIINTLRLEELNVNNRIMKSLSNG